MTTTRQKFEAKIASASTEMLFEIAHRLALPNTNEEILIANAVDRELENRLSELEFMAHLELMEAILDSAA